jgi:hypothetical protein
MKKTISILLLCAMLCSAVGCASGSEDSESTETTAAETVSAEETVAEETETERLTADLPERDFEGYTFVGATKGTSSAHWTSRDFYAEELTGEAINDAVYNRNLAVCDRYNFKMEEYGAESGEPVSDAEKAVTAGEDTYDVILAGATINSMITKGMLYDLYNVPYMDLSQPWYDQNANSSLSIANKLYVSCGDLNIMDNDATWSILFNKRLAEDLGLGNFYDMVKEGTWTQDVLLSAMEAACIDLNGDGVRDSNDQWGNVGESFDVMAYMIGAGARCFTKDENDMPVLAVDSERYVDAYSKANAINGNANLCLTAVATNWDWDLLDGVFTEGRCLFSYVGLNRVTLFRNMEDDFGILPTPKYDEAQENYYNTVSCWSANFFAIPVTASNIERTGIILEALSAESKYTLTPAYYDVTLKTKAARDEESSEMLDIIFNSRVFELANFYEWGGIFDVPGTQSENGNDDIASAVKKVTKVVEKTMQKTIDTILENAT